MNRQESIKLLMKYIGANPGKTAQELSKATGIGIQTFGTLKFLETETMLTSEGTGKEKRFFIVGDNPAEKKEVVEIKEPDVKEPAVKPTASKPSQKGARDTT